MSATRPRPLTHRQRMVLRELAVVGAKTARYLGVRSDVLWRLEERSLVSRGGYPERWSITRKGRDVVDSDERPAEG